MHKQISACLLSANAASFIQRLICRSQAPVCASQEVGNEFPFCYES